ncbi:hypothetical protein Scep_014288 [Stephania cephalantha]|uniref:Cytochrome P450 n=1 Tax=Stephania cephalantha TaxID=152367 RepID=A0AAP0J0N4_9MAGN
MVTTDGTLLSFICLIYSFLIVSLLKKKAKLRPDIKHPPSPPAVPFIGHLHHLSPVIHKSFHRLAQQFGPLIRLRIGASSCVVASSAVVAKEIMKTHESLFTSRPKFGTPNYDIYDGYSFITVEYGHYWRFMKKLCMTQLLSSLQLDRFIHVRREETRKLLKSLVKSSKEGVAVDLGAELMRMLNNVICRMVMRARCSDSNNEAEECRKFGHGGFRTCWEIKKIVKLMKRFDKLVEEVMEEHEKKMKDGVRDAKDMMDVLLDIHHDQNSETKGIKNFIFEMFIAGTETSSTALQWAIAELINNPIVLRKLREEIKSSVGTSRIVQESDVPNLPYLQAIVKETLRLHTPAPLILRRCSEDCKINGFDVPKDTRVLINAYSVMRDPLHWKEPDMFTPERFQRDAEENIGQHQMDMKGLHLHYIPFGSGKRGCPGASLALTAIHGTLATLAQCFDFQVDNEGIDRTIDMEEGTRFTAAMKKPLICYPILRFRPL